MQLVLNDSTIMVFIVTGEDPMVGKLLARQQQYLLNLVEKRRLEKEKEEAEQAAAKQLIFKVT